MKNSDLERRVEMINRTCGCNIALDWTAGRPRLGLAEKDKPGCIGRFISPRVTKAQMMFYLDAFEAGFEEAMRTITPPTKIYGVMTVTCKLCGKETSSKTAHRHDVGWVGDDCCWDERLRSTE